MIFPTLAERDRVFKIIEEKSDFENLTEIQMAKIQGMYWAVESLENVKADNFIDEDSDDEEIIDKCIEAIEVDIAEMYVSFSDNNACLE